MTGTHRRSFLRSALGATAATFWADQTLEAYQQNVRTASKPSDLKITDLRVTAVRAPMYAVLIRIDTNQGIYGLGEVRDGASKNFALVLKSRLLGENPCNVDKIFRKIKQFGFHARQGGGVCGVEMALWDLAGKAYGVPVYQMLGGKFRDKIRIYCDTTSSRDPKIFGQRLKERREQGYTWLKMDLGYQLVADTPGTVTQPVGQTMRDAFNVMHPFTGIELTDKGIGLMADFAMQVREIVGFDVPLSVDHFGHIGVNSCIRLGKALEKVNYAWLEDMIPWQYTDAVNIPTCTGEDIYLKEGFAELVTNHAVDIIQPDLATSGGILETKKIGDFAQEHGVAMAMHFAGTPVSAMANVHCAAATENVLALENHSVDTAWWSDLVTGMDRPLVQKGFITIPDKPGLGIDLNEAEIRKHLAEPGYFEPTPEWDKDRSNDRLWS
jgi:L-alanine-DL-glutamate epimerase-like enolase superfamily enzyme